MEFKAVLKTETLKQVLSAVTAIVTEGVWKISHSGMSIAAVDPANVALCSVAMKASAFEFYKTDEEGSVAFDIPQLLGCLSGNENAILEISDTTKNLKVSMGKIKYSFRLMSTQDVIKPPTIPEMDLPAKVKIESSELKSAFGGAGKATDKAGDVSLSQDNVGFHIRAGSEKTKFEMDFPANECLVQDGESRSLMPLNYLVDMAKNMSGSVIIETGIDYPVKFTFDIGDYIRIKYILAPRLVEDI